PVLQTEIEIEVRKTVFVCFPGAKGRPLVYENNAFLVSEISEQVRGIEACGKLVGKLKAIAYHDPVQAPGTFEEVGDPSYFLIERSGNLVLISHLGHGKHTKAQPPPFGDRHAEQKMTEIGL